MSYVGLTNTDVGDNNSYVRYTNPYAGVTNTSLITSLCISMKGKPVEYNLLQGHVPPGFIYLLDIIQLGTRSLRSLDKVMV